MAENDEAFVPHSDEDLAKLLEEQMRELRAQTGAQPTLPSQAAPVVRDPELEQIFSALLEEDEPEAVVAEIVVSETIIEEFKPVIEAESLTQTEPLTIIHEEVTAFVVSEQAAVLVEDSTPPIPAMFAEQVTEADYIAAALETEVHVVTVAETVSEVVEVNSTNPITNFERRPSFDELVFGAGTSD